MMEDTEIEKSVNKWRAMKHWTEKVLSGRWLLTLLAGVSFLILVIAYVVRGKDHSIDPQAMVTILTAVFMSYFNKGKAQ